MPSHIEALVSEKCSPVDAGSPNASDTTILVNPRSFRVRDRKRMEQIQAIARDSDATAHIVHGPSDIAEALSLHPARGLKRLVIIGGDGTVQAAISTLLENSGTSLPKLLALGGGRTNFTARDLGTHDQPIVRLKTALQSPERFRTEPRAILRLEQPSTGKKLYGLFVAGALVDHVIRDCHQYRAQHRGWLRTGHPSSLWRVLQLAGTGRLGRDAYAAPPMQLNAGCLGQMEQPIRLMVLSTLQHERGLINPYADRGLGDIRITAISNNAKRFWRSLPSLLLGRGRASQSVDGGYLSGRCESLTIRGLQSVCIDGQEWDFCAEDDVIISADDKIDFLAQ